MLTLCYKSHEEICYEGPECPICKLVQKHDKEVIELERAISDLENRLAHTEEQLELSQT